MFINVRNLIDQIEGVIGQRSDMRFSHQIGIFLCQTTGAHISATDGFDFFDAFVIFSTQNLIEICDNFVEKSKTFHALIICLKLGVKFGKIRYQSEHNPDGIATFVIKIAVLSLLFQKIFGDVDGKNVFQKFSIVNL